jgi:hypothetical protein
MVLAMNNRNDETNQGCRQKSRNQPNPCLNLKASSSLKAEQVSVSAPCMSSAGLVAAKSGSRFLCFG